MNAQAQQKIQALDVLLETLQILNPALEAGDGDKAHEAISVMLLQGMHLFGPDSVAMQQFFPVMDTIKRRIDGEDFSGALRQAKLFEKQLQEIKGLVSGATLPAN